MRKYVRDMTGYGDVLDREGSLGKTFDNLEYLLGDLMGQRQPPRKSAKFRVTESRIGYDKVGDQELPYRYSREVVRSLDYLLRYYNSWNCAPRGGFNLEVARQRREMRTYNLQKDRDRADAWGPWIAIQRIHAARQRA